MLILDSPKELQRHLNTLKSFCTNKGLFVNLDKTKETMFNTIQAWVMRSEPQVFLGEKKVAYTQSYTYLRVIFVGPWFSLREVASAQLSRGYAALGALKRQCAHLMFK